MSLSIEQTRLLVSRALEDIIENRERLNELDRALGDGDQGTTIARSEFVIHRFQMLTPESTNDVLVFVWGATTKKT